MFNRLFAERGFHVLVQSSRGAEGSGGRLDPFQLPGDEVIALLIFGVVRNFRWLFWLLLIAFAGSIIQIPIEGFQLLGIIANPYPVWYSVFRGGVGFIELGLAFWMI